MGLAIDPEWVPRGYAYFSPAAAEDLSTPDTGTGYVAALLAGANTMVMTPVGAAIIFTSEGTTPDATHGGYIPAGVTRSFANMRTMIKAFKMVQAAATAVVYVEWYQAPGG